MYRITFTDGSTADAPVTGHFAARAWARRHYPHKRVKSTERMR